MQVVKLSRFVHASYCIKISRFCLEGFTFLGRIVFLFKIIFYLVNFILFIFIAILTFSIKIITTLLVVLCKGNDGIYTACLLQGLVPYNDYILDGSIYKNSVLSCRFALLLAYNSLRVS